MNYKDVTRVLKNLGFKLKRSGKGSHMIWEKGGKSLPVSNHGSKSYGKGILNKMKKEIESILNNG